MTGDTPGAHDDENPAHSIVVRRISEATAIPAPHLARHQGLAELGIDSLRLFQIVFEIESDLQTEFDDDAVDSVLSSATLGDLSDAVRQIHCRVLSAAAKLPDQ